MKDDALDHDSPLASLASVRGVQASVHGASAWPERIHAHCGVNELLRLQHELPLCVVQWDGKKGVTRLELNDLARRARPTAWGAELGQEHHLEYLKRAGRERRLVVGEALGVSHALLALPADPRGRTFLCAGPFLTRELDWEAVSVRWTERTGELPSSASPELLRFVNGALSLPVLEQDALDALEHYLTLLSDLISGQSDATAFDERIEKLKHRAFDPLWSTAPEWSLQTASGGQGELAPPRSEETARRTTTAVMALMPLLPKHQPLEPAQALVASARMKRACARLASRLPETRLHGVDDDGVTLSISISAGKTAARAKADLRERAQKLKSAIQEQFGLVTLVGVGRAVPSGESLNRSRRDALLALQACIQLDKDLLFHDELGAAEESVRYARVDRAAAALSDAFDHAALGDLKSASDEYVRLVLVWSGGRLDVIRGQFLSLLFALIKNVQRRHLLRNEVAENLAEELSQRLEDAPTVHRLLDTFKEALTRLSVFAARALEGPKSMRLDTTLQYLKDNFAQQLRLTSVARKAGFSVPAFSRIFKQATGTSFLVYLRNIRVEQAKLLLRSTSLSAEQVAEACGFQSQHHLIRSFKKVTQATPGSYRKSARPTT